MALKAAGTETLLGAVGVGGSYGAITALKNGRYVAVWTNQVSPFAASGKNVTDSSGQAIVARLLDRKGKPLGAAFQVNQQEDGFQSDPEIIALSNGKFAIAWTDGPTSKGEQEAKVRLFNADGTPASKEIRLNSDTDGDQRIPQLIPAAKGGFYAIWQDERGAWRDVILMQQFKATGQRVGPEIMSGTAHRLDAALLPSGDYTNGRIRILTDRGITATSGSHYFPSTSSPIAQLDTHGSSSTNADPSYTSAITPLTDGRYAWAGVHNNHVVLGIADAHDYDNPVRVPFPYFEITVSKNTVSAGDAPGVQVLGLQNGGILVVWADQGSGNYNIMAQLYNNHLKPVGGNQRVHSGTKGNQVEPFVAQGKNGKVLIGWSDDTGNLGGKPQDLHVRLFNAGVGKQYRVNKKGSAGNNRIAGSKGNDWLDGRAGNDSLLGRGGSDRLLGGKGNDVLKGGLGDDRLWGGPGNDKYYVNDVLGENDIVIENRKSGLDTVYSGQTFTLPEHVENLVFTGTESVTGFGNDRRNRLIGNAGQNTFQANAGNDVLNGKGGDDDLYGMEGNDRLTGGKGADDFQILRAEHGVDTITDFNRKQGDRMMISRYTFGNNRLEYGPLESQYFIANSGGKAKDSNDYFVFNTKTHSLYFDADGSGSGAADKLAIFKNGVVLKYSDIFMS